MKHHIVDSPFNFVACRLRLTRAAHQAKKLGPAPALSLIAHSLFSSHVDTLLPSQSVEETRLRIRFSFRAPTLLIVAHTHALRFPLVI